MGGARHKFDLMGSKIGAFLNMADQRKYKCACGTEVNYPGPCKPCFEAVQKRDLHHAFDSAARTIPARKYAEARFGMPELQARVKSTSAVDTCCRMVREVEKPWTCVTLCGATGCGKTTLALAMLWEVIALARAGVLSERARGAMFVEAKVIAGDVSEQRREAIRAPFLVLDDLGQETDGALPGSVTYAETVGPMRDFLEARLYGDFDTVITTGFGAQELKDMYGENIQRRMFDRNLRNYVLDLAR